LFLDSSISRVKDIAQNIVTVEVDLIDLGGVITLQQCRLGIDKFGKIGTIIACILYLRNQ